jgi:hypothetical protein
MDIRFDPALAASPSGVVVDNPITTCAAGDGHPQ